MWKFVFQVVPVIAWGFAAIVVVLQLRLPRLRAFLAVAALGIAFGKFAFFALVGGDGFTPNLPQYVIWAYGWLYGAAMLLTMLSVAAYLFDGVARLLRCPVPLRVKRVRCIVLIVFAAALALWGIWEGVRIPPVRQVEVLCPGLPQSFDRYRIVHISDLHCSPAARRGRFERIVERVNALKPDLVAITGDFVDGTVAERFDDLAPLADLRAKDGVLGCTGNHEAYWDWCRWLGSLENLGIVFPEVSGVHVTRRGGDMLAVGGLIDSAFCHMGDGAILYPTVKDAFANSPDGAFRILLYHRPYTKAIGSESADVRLQLSGHTHGGAMPVLRWLVERSNEGRSRGVYEFAPGRFLHVSPGTGQWAGFPLRLCTSSEITELILRVPKE